MKKANNNSALENLELRYGAAYVQGLQDSLARCQRREIQYLEVKQMAEILERFRNRMKVVVHHYRLWKSAYESETDQIEKVYAAYEGIFLRRQLGDAWSLYVTVNRDYHEMRRDYLAALRRVPHTRAAA